MSCKEMKIRLYSDLHNEFSVYDVPVMEGESEQVLILAGDIGVVEDSSCKSTVIDFIQKLSYRFKQIIYVCGNHEYYGSVYHKVHEKLYEETDHMHNVCILDDSMFEFEGVIFVGATLWTSLKNADPLVMMEAKRTMNDYWEIKCNNKGNYMRLIPEVTIDKHYYSRDYIFHTAAEHRDKKVVVVSHHPPSYQSVHQHYRSNFDVGMIYNYFSDLDDKIMDNDNIVLWTHGHTHHNFDYKIGDTRVMCNPRGYSKRQDRSENPHFNPNLVITI